MPFELKVQAKSPDFHSGAAAIRGSICNAYALGRSRWSFPSESYFLTWAELAWLFPRHETAVKISP